MALSYHTLSYHARDERSTGAGYVALSYHAQELGQAHSTHYSVIKMAPKSGFELCFACSTNMC